MSYLTKGLSWLKHRPTVVVTTDASMLAWGAHCKGKKVQGLWTSEQSKMHINVLELLAVAKALKVLSTWFATERC